MVGFHLSWVVDVEDLGVMFVEVGRTVTQSLFKGDVNPSKAVVTW